MSKYASAATAMEELNCYCLRSPPLHLSHNVGRSSTQHTASLFGEKILPAPLLFRSRNQKDQVAQFIMKPGIRATSSGSDTYLPNEANDMDIAGDSALCNGAAKGADENSRGLETVALKKTTNIEEIKLNLKRYGVAGVLSYGLLNTVYYLGMFLFVWFYVAPSPGGLGYRAAVQRFIKLLALVWAGSQVTKLLRAGCALALAPVIDNVLTWFTSHFGFQSRGKAFGAIVVACVGLALVVFVTVTSLWA